MLQKITLKVFRFDHTKDYLPYFKTYMIESTDDKTLFEVLQSLEPHQPIELGIEHLSFCKINGLFTSNDLLVKEALQRCGNEWVIEPISEYRATKDLQIDTSDYSQKLQLLNPFLSLDQLVDYGAKYFLEYYASSTLHFKKEYIGDHILLIAYDILQRSHDPLTKAQIIQKLKCKETGIWYHTPFSDRLFKDSHQTASKIEQLFAICGIDTTYFHSDLIHTIPEQYRQSFEGFNIAYYNQSDKGILKEKLGANTLTLPSAYENLALYSQEADDTFSLQIAGKILLETKDNNGDFLVVNNSKELEIFDRKQKKIEALVGRDIQIPVITKEQFKKLIEGEKEVKNLGFDKHTVKVSFLE